MSEQQPIMYADMVAVAVAELEYSGIKDGAMDIARRIAAEFCNSHGGKIYRVPTMKAMIKARRDDAMREDAKRLGTKQLCRKYQLSERQVREIVG